MNKENFKSSKRVKLFILLMTAFVIAFFFPKGESLESEVSIGSIWIQDDLIAPMSFPILKNNEIYRKEIDAAKKYVYPIFLKDLKTRKQNIDSLNSYSSFLISIINNEIEQKTSQENQTFLSSSSFLILKSIQLKESNLKRNSSLLKKYFLICEQTLAMIYDSGILNQNYEEIKNDSIAVRSGNTDKISKKENFYELEKAKQIFKQNLLTQKLPNELFNALFEFGIHFLKPNLFFNQDLTLQELNIAKDKVSKYSGIVNENERIVAKHDRISHEVKLKIDSYKIAKGEMINSWQLVLQFVGKFFHIISLLILISIYIFLFRKKIYNDNSKLLLFSILYIWIGFVTFIIHQFNFNDSLRLLVFIPSVSMLCTIIFDSRVGFYNTVILSLITGALNGNDYSFAAMNIVAGSLSVYTVRDIKNRTQIFRSFLFILVGYTITIIAFGLERFDSWQKIFIEFAFAGTSALISPVLTYGLLIFFERIFKITTELTLLELSNFDRPLLRELARNAPGSFNHSLTIGTIAEAAAEAIKVNSLLARVGAYYHDVGKSFASQYFVENQLDNSNVHEELKPEESVNYIINHVQKGIDLARENNIPQEIVDFIPMHHGTTVVNYFYQKAIELYGADNIDIDDFRYPGPKPNTKETAIVMLADTCESAVRSIENPDAEKVENLIANLINARIEDEQLNDSPLTFNDISIIKETFVNILLGQHHKRIRYPQQEEMEKGEQ